MKRLLTALTLTLFSLSLQAGDPPAVGSEAPGFRLQDQNGDWHSLADYRDGWLAVYFYPKDDTPGCTTEACSFRDSIYAFE
ncbi:MAG TPA: redoxin domain-containing protein, partial [Xanthomonadales bacterium]|nr:redoxin domain-containing protein [Xanthomonadales bacterium]